MVRLLSIFLKGIWISVLLISLMTCQRQQTVLYRKDFSPTEQQQLSRRLVTGIGVYYQGNPEQHFLLQEAMQYDSSYADIYREIGVPYLKRGIATGFYEYYARAADMDPLKWTGWRGYLYLYFYRDYERAIADFNATDTLTPNFVDYPQSLSVHFMRGICYLMLKNYEEAIRYLELHIQNETEQLHAKTVDSPTYLYLGITYWELGNLEKAEEYFRKGQEVDPRNADFHYWLARLAVHSKQNEAARQLLDRAKILFQDGYYFNRPYVEEFYQLYWSDLEDMEAGLVRK